jgi:3-oxoacyl-[acyl-carrier protein] reductase
MVCRSLVQALDRCEQTAAQIRKNGGKDSAIQTDVSDESQVDALIRETVNRYGRLDILVNNSGIFGGGRLADTTTKAFDEVMNTNLRGTFFGKNQSV